MEDEVNRLNKISDSFHKLSKKVKLYSLLKKADSEYQKCDYSSGRKTLQYTLTEFPNNVEALRGLGCVEQFDGNLDEALEYFFKSSEYSDDKEVDYTLIAMVYYLKEDFDTALKYFDMAIEYNEEYTSAYEGRNQAMLENHLKILDLQDALEKFFK